MGDVDKSWRSIRDFSPPEYSAYLSGLERADERTRTAYPCSIRVIGHELLGVAHACKCRIFRGVSFLRVAECCTVLRSRWYQSGIRTSDSYGLTAGPMTRTPDLRSHNPPTCVSGRCRMCRALGGIVLPRRGAWRSGAQGSREGEGHLRLRGGITPARTSP